MYAVRSNETIRVYDSFAYRGSIKDMQDRFYDADDKCWVRDLCQRTRLPFRKTRKGQKQSHLFPLFTFCLAECKRKGFAEFVRNLGDV